MPPPILDIRLLGPVRVLRRGVESPLPASRKVRALLATLALARAPISRSRLCDLLWDAPNDPKGELRWCLSKLRGLLDDEDRRRVITSGPSTVALDLTDCVVDALELERCVREGVERAPTERLVELCDLWGGDLLEGMLLDGPVFMGWLVAERERLRTHHAALVRELEARPAPSRVTDAAPASPPVPEVRRARRSVAVMPFECAAPGPDLVAVGLTDDIITRLAKLRALFVIARGTSYALRDRGLDAREMGRLLNVDYVVSGEVRRRGDRIVVRVELAETRTAGIVWTDAIEGLDASFGVIDTVVDRIAATIAEEIERAECARAVLKAPSSLDAWEAYHRGLVHMYRFNARDNAIGARFFENALALDPSFARAHAGLSFTHFQNVFLELTPDRDEQRRLAFETASRSLDADDRDPAAHWAMGRALWLSGDHHESVAELERCVELSPNFALGHYTLGFVQAQSGDPAAAIEAVDHSRALSPFDPLQFAMLCSRAIAHMRLGEREAAAEWATRAASRPNAHVHILAIAAANLALVHRPEPARELVGRLLTQAPSYRIEALFRAFRFTDEARAILAEGARRLGFD